MSSFERKIRSMFFEVTGSMKSIYPVPFFKELHSRTY